MLREELRGVDEVAAETGASAKGHDIVAKALAQGVERDGEVALVARHGAAFIDVAEQIGLNAMGVGLKIAHAHAGEADMHALGPYRGQQIACDRPEYVLVVGRVSELALDRPALAKGVLEFERDGAPRQSAAPQSRADAFGEKPNGRLHIVRGREVLGEGPFVAD